MHLDLRHDSLGVRGTLQGHDLGEWLAADHHASRMGRSISHHTFKLLSEADEFPILRAVGVGRKFR